MPGSPSPSLGSLQGLLFPQVTPRLLSLVPEMRQGACVRCLSGIWTWTSLLHGMRFIASLSRTQSTLLVPSV